MSSSLNIDVISRYLILQEAAAADTPDSADSSSSLSNQPQMMGDHERSGSNASSRLPLPLPLPNAMSQQSRSSVMPYDRMSESTSPRLAHLPKRELAFDDSATNRLPSITAQGLLIENGVRDASPNYARSVASPAPLRADRFSPTSASSYHESSSGWSTGSAKQYREADNRSSVPAPTTDGLTSPVRTANYFNDRHQRYQQSVEFAPTVA